MVTTTAEIRSQQPEQEPTPVPPLEELEGSLIIVDSNASFSYRAAKRGVAYLRRGDWFKNAETDIMPDSRDNLHDLIASTPENSLVAVIGDTSSFTRAATSSGTGRILVPYGRGEPYVFHNGRGNEIHPEQAHDTSLAVVRTMPLLQMRVDERGRRSSDSRKFTAAYWAGFGVASTLMERLELAGDISPKARRQHILKLIEEIGEGAHTIDTIGCGFESKHRSHGHIYMNYPRLEFIRYQGVGSETGRPVAFSVSAENLVQSIRKLMDGREIAWELQHELRKGEHALSPSDGAVEVLEDTKGSADTTVFDIHAGSRITTSVVEDGFRVLSRRNPRPMPGMPFLRRELYISSAARAFKQGQRNAHTRQKIERSFTATP